MKKLFSTITPLVFVAILLLSACTKENLSQRGFDMNFPAPTQTITKVTLNDAQRGYLEDGNQFSLELLDAVFDDNSILVSPLGIQMVLGMALNGANGQTAEEILSVLGYGANDEKLVNEYHKSLLDQLPALDSKARIRFLDAAIVEEKIKLKESFQNVMRDYYYAPAESVSFSSNDVLTKINEWSGRNTDGLIFPLLEELPDAGTKAFMLNALYFNAKWKEEKNGKPLFVKSEDKKNNIFYTSPDKTTGQEYLIADNSLPYFDTAEYQLVGLPYAHGNYLMYILLPKGDGTEACRSILSSITSSELKTAMRAAKSKSLIARIPAFEVTNDIHFKDALKSLGIHSAFETAADFSRMTEGPSEFHLGDVMQKSVIKVTEWGTEAASVSETYIPEPIDTADEYTPLVFNANHPFVFFIAERETCAILFEGVYSGSSPVKSYL